MLVSEPWYTYLVNGTKTVEGRKASPKWISTLQSGYSLKITNGIGNYFILVITEIHRYQSIREYLEKEGLERCLPGVTSLELGERIYRQWSTEEELAQYDFLGICVKPLNPELSNLFGLNQLR